MSKYKCLDAAILNLQHTIQVEILDIFSNIARMMPVKIEIINIKKMYKILSQITLNTNGFLYFYECFHNMCCLESYENNKAIDYLDSFWANALCTDDIFQFIPTNR